MVVSWFSAGVSSAVATKLVINEVDKIIYTHIDDQHPDTMRFVKDCEKWFGKEIEILQSPYGTVENAMRAACYVNGVHGAPCTRLLKRRVRQEWEMDKSDLSYIWGFDYNEKERSLRINETMPQQEHIFPLIDKGISKDDAHRILSASGIKRPEMYDMGYHNNNCIGCVKGGMGYWNKIRVDFPDVFQMRAETERLIGGTCIKGIYLDELSPDAGRKQDFIFDDCGVLCDALSI
jgi:hypothetical protein